MSDCTHPLLVAARVASTEVDSSHFTISNRHMHGKLLIGCLVATLVLTVFDAGLTPILAQQPVRLTRLSAATPRVTNPDVLRQQSVEVTSLALLSDPQRSPVLQLDLFADVSFRAIRERIEPTARGVTWIGGLEGYPHSDAFFTVVGDELVGHIFTPFGFFRIEREAGRYLVQQVDRRRARQRADVEQRADQALITPRNVDATTRADDGSVIDILVAYTQEALKKFRSGSRAQAEIDIAIAETNQAFANSGLSTRMRLVHSTTVEYEETGDSSTDLVRLALPDDGLLDTVHALRDRYAADIVALITERMDDACGRTYLQTMTRGPRFAFFVSGRACLGDIGTFPHEVGHQIGATHDWYDTDTPGAYTYSHGYVSVAGRFQDIMAGFGHCTAANTGCDMLLFFANPDLTYQQRRQGVASGTATTCVAGNLNNPDCDADLARTFANMAPFVAKFRDSGARGQ